MKLPKPNQKGITHILAPLLFIAIFAGIGAIVLSRSHALTPADGGGLETADDDQVYYATGAIPPPDNVHKAMSLPSNAGAADRQLPASVDLTKWAAPVKNQGNISSCVAWAIDYDLFGWYVNKYNYPGGMHAPMFTYAQIVNGRNTYTTPADNFKIATYQGIDTVTHYSKPFYDYHYLPTSEEQKNAAKYRIKWYFNIFTGVQTGSTAQTLLKHQLSSGNPAVILMPVYKEFAHANSNDSLVGVPAVSNNPLLGWHEVTALGYNSKGLMIENSWGKKWGDKGFGTLSWDFVNQYVGQADAITGINVNQ